MLNMQNFPNWGGGKKLHQQPYWGWDMKDSPNARIIASQQTFYGNSKLVGGLGINLL
jgi:hypothetical protein